MTSEKPIVWGAALAVLAGAAALYYFYAIRGPVQITAPAPPPVQSAPAPSGPAIEHPVPAGTGQASSQPPLPALNDSDQAIQGAITAVPSAAAAEKFLVPQNLIRHVVATIDNLPRKKVAVELRPVQPIPGQFEVSGTPDHLTLNPDNFKRYTPFVDLVKNVDTKQLAAVYFRFYPLFQQAYEDLGYPTEYFNDRVIEVIDHLLETPDVKGPIELVQPNVMYLYADPKLEALSAGQKTLIRMGSENAAIIKAKLREFRDLLATHPSSTSAAAPPVPKSSASTSSTSLAPAPAAAPYTAPSAAPAPAPSSGAAPAGAPPR
jgi:hypothetical protein